MIFLGNELSKKQAVLSARRIANEKGLTVVVEKAKAKDDHGHLRVCWRGWLDIRGEFTGRTAPGVALLSYTRDEESGKSKRNLHYLEEVR